MNYPVWKYHPEKEPILVRDMVQDAILGPEWVLDQPLVEDEPKEVHVERRKPGRPKKVA